MNNDFERINKIANQTNINDFRIEQYNSVNLILTGSFDFAYYYQVKVTFFEVSYISLPTDFSYPIFRVANESEIANISKQIALYPEDIVYCIEAETSTSIKRILFFIVAEGMEVVEELVKFDWTYKK
ncbi:hypothetical protein [Myxosarcina sp. GI1]|uniref:hypothetical protein n=1 Tax=Myxosarcina sp. GI1 TaxID=1541065 RepID=UPI0005695DC1|nr:hypothetical protein [Myxosarcina sp. GI1]